MAEAPTPEEILKVRRQECMFNGHTWDVMESDGKGPVKLVCSNCGESHPVGGEEVRQLEDALAAYFTGVYPSGSCESLRAAEKTLNGAGTRALDRLKADGG